MSNGSVMTQAERAWYLDPPPDGIDVMAGYPAVELLPQEARLAAQNPPAGFLYADPLPYIRKCEDYFTRLLGGRAGCRVRLVSSCSEAFTAALTALTPPGATVGFTECSFGEWPGIAENTGRHPVFLPRGETGIPHPGSIDGLGALVLVIPDNPLGWIPSADALDSMAGACTRAGIPLIVDYCLAAVNPVRRFIPPIAEIATSALDWAALGDTGKLIGLTAKLGAIGTPPRLAGLVEDACSLWGYQYRLYDLAVLSRILPGAHGLAADLSFTVRSNYLILKDALELPATAERQRGGSFAVLDSGTTDSREWARRLAARRVGVVPVSVFPPYRGDDTQIRVSLARHPSLMRKVARAASETA